MYSSNNYTQHVNIVKNLKMADCFYEVREPYKEDFEKIYEKAQKQNIGLNNAKDFLNSLSKDELKTLQNFTLLVDDINTSSLSDEGAYNLLLHHYEKYDFNNDGITEDGIGKKISLIPQNLSNNEKKALVDTFNSMDFKDVMMASIVLMPPIPIQMQSINQDIDMQTIKQRIENILNPKNEKYSTKEFRDTIRNFWDQFNQNYKKIMEVTGYYNLR